MAKTIKEEKLKWVIPIVKGEVRLIDVSKVCPYGKRSLEGIQNANTLSRASYIFILP